MDMTQINRKVIDDFRAGGEIGVDGIHRERLVLLTTTGRSSGEPRTTPMMFLPSDRGVIVVASNNGAPEVPEWFRNLEQDPAVHVELPDDEFDATAEIADASRRSELWPDVVERAPFFAEHEERAGRELPVVELVRSERPASS